MTTSLTCFKAYDVRGQLGININENICYRIGRAFARHLRARTIILGHDARETSPRLATAVAQYNAGVDQAAEVMRGTSAVEALYFEPIAEAILSSKALLQK